MARAVFYDPQRKRWKRLRLALNLAGVASTLLIVFFAISLLRGTPLPSSALPDAHPQYRKLTNAERRQYRRIKPVARRKSNKAPSQVVLNSGEGIRAAFYVQWDAGSLSSLKEYAHQIDMLYPEWLHVLTPDGHLQAVSQVDGRLFDVLKDGKARPVDPEVMDFLKREKLPMEVFPMVNNFDPGRNVWESEGITTMMETPAGRARFRSEMMTFLTSDNYKGIVLDLEGFPGSAQPGYRALLAELNDDLHGRGMKLYVSVPASDPDFDMPFVAAHSDGLIIMDYDEHYLEGEPGPVASQDWFVKNLERAVKLVPREKIICAIANYGYDWPVSKQGKVLQGVDTLSVQDSWLRASESEADVDLDSDSLNPHYTYVDDASGNRREVWFTDAVTALNEMRAARALGISTFALWRLGAEDRSLWKIWDNPGASDAADLLKNVPPGHDVDHENSGEVMRIEQRPTPGERTVSFDPDRNLFDGESYTKLPLPYQLAHYGASKKQIAISFDDGPDPDWTPKMLDVLKEYHAPATFFVIGNMASRYPSILKRMYREGHEIGNHSFTHPNVDDISKRTMELELNATERLFEAKLGVKPLYFRPPYSIDQDPEIDDDVRPLEVVQNMGYIMVGAKLDDHDWEPGKSADQIVQGILDNLPPCAQTAQACGNIILLHDGGGSRAESVKALPRIIEGVRARGFEIVPVSALMGKTRAQVMPPISSNEQWSAWVDSVGFTVWGTLREIIVLIFFIGDVLMSLRFLFVSAFALFDRLRSRRLPAEAVEHFKPKVAVIIPAYNEEKVIVQTVRAALDSDYPDLRVVVVDDGSKDRTHEVTERAFQPEIASGRLILLTKENAGKAEALNYGLKFCTEEIFVGIDADTLIAPAAISRLVPHFLDRRVAAVAGNAKVGNRINVWTRWQALEYITSQNFERRALNTLAAVTVVPGALGAWRTSLVREAGGYHIDTVAEDADLTMALLKSGYRIEYEDRALAYTEAPISANGLMRQRFRWSFGILQSLWKHREVFGRKGVLGYVALPNILVFQILLPLVSPFIDIMFVAGVLSYFIDRHFHPATADASSLYKLLIFFLMFLIIDFITSAVAFALERRGADEKEDVLLLLDVWLQRFAYRQLFSIVLFRTLKRAFEGKPFAWDKLERTAHQPYATAGTTPK
jgi:peptidoglycan-N-acetylglucosamine deacetylase